MFDVTIVAVVVGAVVMVVVRVRGARGLARKRRWWNAAFDVVALAGAVYLVFMTTWGWHYRRMPLATRLDVRAEGREIGAVTKEISAIAVGEKENAGRLIIELGELT